MEASKIEVGDLIAWSGHYYLLCKDGKIWHQILDIVGRRGIVTELSDKTITVMSQGEFFQLEADTSEKDLSIKLLSRKSKAV